MSRDAKMDLHGVRTASDLERKYQFNKSFAEIAGIATDARTTAEQAKQEVIAVDESLTSEEIFNRLTNNGEEQGIYREDGKIYINAEYVNFDELNGKSLNLTGKLTCTTNAYIPPGDEEIEFLRAVVEDGMTIPDEAIPLYDFDPNGTLNVQDIWSAQSYSRGSLPFSEWSGAVATPIEMTIDMTKPDRAITFTGKNMWGRDVSGYIGVAGTSIKHIGTADYVVESGTQGQITDQAKYVEWTWRKWNSGKAECWCKQEVTGAFTAQWGSMYILNTRASKLSYPVTFVEAPVETVTARAPLNACLVFPESAGDGMNTEYETAVYNAVRPTEVAGQQTVEFSYYVIGKWK